MKTLLFASGFAVAMAASFTWVNGGEDGERHFAAASSSEYMFNDTTPKKKKDSTHRVRKDSTIRKDSTRPKKDSTQ